MTCWHLSESDTGDTFSRFGAGDLNLLAVILLLLASDWMHGKKGGFTSYILQTECMGFL